MLPDLLATQRSELLAELRSKLVEYSGDRILVVLAPATASVLMAASAPYPHAGAFLGWIQHPELGWCGATAFIDDEKEEDCCFDFRKLLRRAGSLLSTLDVPVCEDGVRQSEPYAAKWVSTLTAEFGKVDFHESPVPDVGISIWILKKAWSKSIELAESLGWDSSVETTVREPMGNTPEKDWLKTGLPPDGWHKTPLCGYLMDIHKWADTSDKTLHDKNGKRWWVTAWTGKDTPFAIYFPTPQQYGDAVKRRAIQNGPSRSE